MSARWRRPRPEGLIRPDPLPNHLANAKACAPQTRLRDADSPEYWKIASFVRRSVAFAPFTFDSVIFHPFARVLLTRSLLTRSLVCYWLVRLCALDSFVCSWWLVRSCALDSFFCSWLVRSCALDSLALDSFAPVLLTRSLLTPSLVYSWLVHVWNYIYELHVNVKNFQQAVCVCARYLYIHSNKYLSRY